MSNEENGLFLVVEDIIYRSGGCSSLGYYPQLYKD